MGDLIIWYGHNVFRALKKDCKFKVEFDYLVDELRKSRKAHDFNRYWHLVFMQEDWLGNYFNEHPEY